MDAKIKVIAAFNSEDEYIVTADIAGVTTSFLIPKDGGPVMERNANPARVWRRVPFSRLPYAQAAFEKAGVL